MGDSSRVFNQETHGQVARYVGRRNVYELTATDREET